ncbi:hypothetical protein [Anaerosinus massiliensis]|uniref:hypothetical protein n=1 Tax=Massilibacillus massiliensis TaxID=1806837 RepID=UPI0018FEFCED|nr:hypothetical protein [Massilibacillus massiliensis]
MDKDQFTYKRIIRDDMYCILSDTGNENKLSDEALQSIEDFKKFINEKYALDYK